MIKDNYCKINLAWFIYFTGMFVLYTKTYVQLGLQIFIILYVIINLLRRNFKIGNKKQIITYIMFFLWYGLLLTISILSIFYAVYQKKDSNTNLSMIRIFAISFVLIYYCNSEQKLYSIMKSFILSVFIMAVISLITTPLQYYFKEGGLTDNVVNDGFGSAIGQHRNAIAMYCVISLFFMFLLYKNNLMKFNFIIAIIMIITLLCTGSRAGIIQFVICSVLYYIFVMNNSKKIKYIFPVIFFVIIFLVVIKNVPLLYNNIYLRLENMVSTLIFESSLDGSTIARNNFKKIAWQMFKNKPIIGYGVDGFYSYLENIRPIQYLNPVYSHCNFTELASCYGIIGLLCWYWMIIYFLYCSIKYRRYSFVKYLTPIVISLVIMDYAHINFSNHFTMYVYIIIFMVYRIFSSKYSN